MQEKISEIVMNLFGIEAKPTLSVPEERFGDVATNVAMQITKQVGKPPREIAEAVVAELEKLDEVEQASVAGPGFINIRVSCAYFIEQIESEPVSELKGKVVVCEYSDMNAFKTAHIGHLYTTLVGDAVANILEHCGAKVVRANFGGDVGLHVGKAMWGILKKVENEPSKLQDIEVTDRSAWVAARYIEGNNAYEQDEEAKLEIISINKKVYALHEANDHESTFAQIYWTCREWSYDGFEQFYSQLELGLQADGSHFVYYPESKTAPFGVELVKKGLENGVFASSDGAVVYKGEDDGLHTRVFLTKDGLPTYETKDLGLAYRKWQDYHYDKSIIITANDITEYMKVILIALSKVLPETAGKTKHLTHGLVKMAGGEKMSSRKGNVLLPEDVLEAARKANFDATGKQDEKAVLGAVKYAFLKNRIGGDMIYDANESVSIHGNSGPYLQYAHARARSILRKSKIEGQVVEDLETGERTLVRKLAEYNAVVSKSVEELAPHVICTYLYELAQEFNRFYEQNTVIGDSREASRLWLVERYADTLKSGLKLLGIHAPEQM
jgi:arginyl-tRNA synthetase